MNKLKIAVDNEHALLIKEDSKNLPYEILFIDSKSFNFEDFKNKSNGFELVLNIINDDTSRIDNEEKYVKEVLEKKEVWTYFINYII